MPETASPQPGAADAVPSIGKTCPFCQGAGELYMIEKLHAVRCSRCGAGSEPAPTIPLAIANWGKRVRAFESRPSTWFRRTPDAEVA